MIVKCITSNVNLLSSDRTKGRIKRYIQRSDGLLPFQTGDRFTVYGLVFRDNCLWYLICTTEHDESPTPYPSEVFEIISGEISKYWGITGKGNGNSEFYLSFKEWTKNFFERLIDGDPEAINMFLDYRKKMDEEAEKEPESV